MQAITCWLTVDLRMPIFRSSFKRSGNCGDSASLVVKRNGACAERRNCLLLKMVWREKRRERTFWSFHFYDSYPLIIRLLIIDDDSTKSRLIWLQLREWSRRRREDPKRREEGKGDGRGNTIGDGDERPDEWVKKERGKTTPRWDTRLNSRPVQNGFI